jgi:hypothetical protein
MTTYPSIQADPAGTIYLPGGGPVITSATPATTQRGQPGNWPSTNGRAAVALPHSAGDVAAPVGWAAQRGRG